MHDHSEGFRAGEAIRFDLIVERPESLRHSRTTIRRTIPRSASRLSSIAIRDSMSIALTLEKPVRAHAVTSKLS